MSLPNTVDPRPRHLRRNLFLLAAALQIGCGIVFAGDIIVERAAFTTHTWVEILGVIGLFIGASLSISQYRLLLRRTVKVERELKVASGAFQEVMDHYFRNWGLTDAECDVALLSIKGASIAEIAQMRQTRPGTIKAQNAAIYRKSGVSSRAELLSVMVEELIAGLEPTPRPDPRQGR
ncbi:MAG: helix-turn-helix transcriptional regulator [Pseudorhodobacter sp.]|nr:helix-turn-helix transcriptional regulator [Pseudorhodobacter sp.]